MHISRCETGAKQAGMQKWERGEAMLIVWNTGAWLYLHNLTAMEGAQARTAQAMAKDKDKERTRAQGHAQEKQKTQHRRRPPLACDIPPIAGVPENLLSFLLTGFDKFKLCI